MAGRSRLLQGRLLPGAAALLGVALAAWASATAPDRPLVVGPLSLSAEQLTERLARVSPSELRGFGATPAAARLAYVEQVLATELLYRAEAERLGLPREPHVQRRQRDVLFRALAARERAALPAPNEQEVARYYEAHRRDFERPERIALWRILVSSEQEARRILASVRGAGGPERWRAHARESSVDTATKERGGDLGFVHPDGRTDVPELRVDPALVAAARAVENGELVPDPVREGERFAVVWRRGSLAPVKMPLIEARPLIERQLTDQKLAQRLDELTARLARDHVAERRDDLLELAHVPAFP